MQTPRRPELWRYAVADKLPSGRYLLFFEADERFKGAAWDECEFFPSPNGFHVIANHTASAETKRYWWRAWKCLYPNSDYQIGNVSWLAPHSQAEARFIAKVAGLVPMTCTFYRDKAVFEEWERREA